MWHNLSIGLSPLLYEKNKKSTAYSERTVAENELELSFYSHSEFRRDQHLDCSKF